MLLTIGHDSEFGLSKDGVILSALDHIKPFESEDGRYFPDNLNTEIAINPVTTLKSFHEKTENLLNHIRSQGFDLIMEPIIKYPNNTLDHPQALISGCNPDFSGYTFQENESPSFEKMDGTRSCGAHIHVGDSSIDPFNFARWMDIFVALPLLLKEKNSTRRSLYGAAGCLRVKPYGAEYRTLSNVWLNEPNLREFVWEGTHKAVEKSKKTNSLDLNITVPVQVAINQHNIDLANKLLDDLYIFGVTKCD